MSTLKTENERMRAALRSIRDHAAKVSSSDPATAYYRLGCIDASAAIGLNEPIEQAVLLPTEEVKP